MGLRRGRPHRLRMGQVIDFPRSPLLREGPLPDPRLWDRTNVADFPIVFCSGYAVDLRRGRRSLLDIDCSSMLIAEEFSADVISVSDDGAA